jgi:hypothetical protein
MASGQHSYTAEITLEWQIVGEFFAFKQRTSGVVFDHPRPNVTGKVDFCTYWIESWSLEPGQEFAIGRSGALSPFGHLAAAYPSSAGFVNEVVALQGAIKAPLKFNVSLPSILSMTTD